MKLARVFLGLAGFYAGGAALLWTVAHLSRPLSEGQRAFLAEFRRPIDFYGVVLEEVSRTPVAGAEVFLCPLDDPNARQPSEHRRTSDATGRFELSGARGASLYVKVTKAGYYETALSQGTFVHGRGGPGGGERPLTPEPGAPAPFYLHKQGTPAARLRHVDHGTASVPKDGSPVDFSLSRGRDVPLGSLPDTIQVECWTDDAHQDERGYYDWRCRLSVPGGGLVPRAGEFNFMAPEGGYQPAVEFNLSKSKPGWSKSEAGEYFCQLANGTFARVRFEMIARGHHFFTVTSYLNPTPGDRNLEAGAGTQGNTPTP